MRIKLESHKAQCLAQEKLLLTGQLLCDSPCLSLTGGVASGKTVCLIFFLCKVKRVGSYYILIFRTTQKDGKLANYLCFQKRWLRFRRVTALPKGKQLIHGGAGSKRGPLSLAPCPVHGRAQALLEAIPCPLTHAIFTFGHGFLGG